METLVALNSERTCLKKENLVTNKKKVLIDRSDYMHVSKAV